MKKFLVTLSFLAGFTGLGNLTGMAQRVAPPTMGWSSWNTYRVNISDTLICRQADAMASTGLGKAGYRYINIDDGFFGGRAADGRLLIHPRRFPNGLRPVVDHIHALGFKAGIYSDAGHNTCGNYWDNDTIARGVGFYEHDERDANFYFRDLGFDFIKIDFCGGDANQNSERLQLDERERYTAIRRAIDATGRCDVRVNICRWAFPGTWVSEVGSSWRIAGDINASWGSVKRIIRENRYLSAYATGGSYNDMDMLEIGRGLSPEEERTHFALWCIQSSPLLIGCDLTSIPAASLQLISNPEMIAVNQDPLGLQAYLVSQDGPLVYVKDIEKREGPTRAVAVCNLGERDTIMAIPLSSLDLSGRTDVRDLIERRTLSTIHDDTLRVSVKAHDTQLLRLRAQHRTLRHTYEAETAWLNRYQELGMNPTLGYATPTDDANCSGGAKVGYIGLHKENYLEWRDVYVERSGEYQLTLHYSSPDDRVLFLSVNDMPDLRFSVPGRKAGTLTAIVKLKKGKNRIRISNPEGWCPDIDRMEVEKSPRRHAKGWGKEGSQVYIMAGGAYARSL